MLNVINKKNNNVKFYITCYQGPNWYGNGKITCFVWPGAKKTYKWTIYTICKYKVLILRWQKREKCCVQIFDLELDLEFEQNKIKAELKVPDQFWFWFDLCMDLQKTSMQHGC